MNPFSFSFSTSSFKAFDRSLSSSLLFYYTGGKFLLMFRTWLMIAGSIPTMSLCDQAKMSWFLFKNSTSACFVVVSKFLPTFTTLVGFPSSSWTSSRSSMGPTSSSKSPKRGSKSLSSLWATPYLVTSSPDWACVSTTICNLSEVVLFNVPFFAFVIEAL